jgi:hypothetical protein
MDMDIERGTGKNTLLALLLLLLVTRYRQDV